MNSKQMTTIVLGVAIVGGIVWALKRAQDQATPTTRVTNTAKGDLVTSPINVSRAAVLLDPLKVALDAFAKGVQAVKAYIPGSTFHTASSDKLTRQGSPVSAVAAAIAPLRADYRASIDPTVRTTKPAEVSRAGNSFQFN